MNRVWWIGLGLLAGIATVFAILYFVEKHSHNEDALSSSKLIYQLLHKTKTIKVEYKTIEIKVPQYVYVSAKII